MVASPPKPVNDRSAEFIIPTPLVRELVNECYSRLGAQKANTLREILLELGNQADSEKRTEARAHAH
ncbi:MAG TPA: hypothetical protein VG122_13750 [Gemmata sp.]|jgi:hypothetical protein|nr:hypothetical protein [Gemmata sp.]